jgi:tetratricopeptide (TPR) repeat protein
MLAYSGRVDEAQQLVSAAAADLTELGLSVEMAAAESVRGAIADARDDLEDAERALRRSYDGFRAIDDAANGGVVAVDLAHMLARLGKHAEAEEMASVAAELAAGFDVEAQIGWRTASARARSALGDSDGAGRLVREVTERLEMTDFTVLRADSLSAMADVFESLGRLDEAIDAIEASRKEYAAKGHVIGEQRAAERLAALNAAQSS